MAGIYRSRAHLQSVLRSLMPRMTWASAGPISGSRGGGVGREMARIVALMDANTTAGDEKSLWRRIFSGGRRRQARRSGGSKRQPRRAAQRLKRCFRHWQTSSRPALPALRTRRAAKSIQPSTLAPNQRYKWRAIKHLRGAIALVKELPQAKNLPKTQSRCGHLGGRHGRNPPAPFYSSSPRETETMPDRCRLFEGTVADLNLNDLTVEIGECTRKCTRFF